MSAIDQLLHDYRPRPFEQLADEFLVPIEEGPTMCVPGEYHKA